MSYTHTHIYFARVNYRVIPVMVCDFSSFLRCLRVLLKIREKKKRTRAGATRHSFSTNPDRYYVVGCLSNLIRRKPVIRSYILKCNLTRLDSDTEYLFIYLLLTLYTLILRIIYIYITCVYIHSYTQRRIYAYATPEA